jgi:hypothetical protein
MWFSSLVGGAANLFATVGCGAMSWLFFRGARREPMFTKVLGYMMSAFFAFCVVAMTGVFNG